jgi:subtilisin family serine protease
MSLGFSKSFKDFNQFVGVIGPEIDEAYRRDIIMFAAAGNGGGFDRVGYPAMSPKVIPVFSTDGFAATRSNFSPLALENGISFSALGEDIESSWPGNLDESHRRIKSGTSFATPLVAGFAATLLEYGRQQLWESVTELKHLYSDTGMKAVLKLVARGRKNPETQYFDLQPWDFFEGKGINVQILKALEDSLYPS